MTARAMWNTCVFCLLVNVMCVWKGTAFSTGAGKQIVWKNGHPDLFSEMTSMLELSAMVYAFATLRKMATEKPDVVKRADLIMADRPVPDQKIPEMYTLTEPISAKDVKEFIEANKETLEKDDEIKHNKESWLLYWDAISKLEHANARLVEFADRFQETELVYAITINKDFKRVTVIFCGSVLGGKDWSKNLNFPFAEMPTPAYLRKKRNFTKTIRVHKGFKSYLLDDTPPKEGFPKRKYGEIVRHLENIYLHENSTYKDYNLYITGHSLGGALCTLLAFRLAGGKFLKRTGIPTPINCISFASPYVGGEEWNEAFQVLERDGRLRHIRVSNQNDIVPVSPPLPHYTHTGINLHLKDAEDTYEIGYRNLKGMWSQHPLSFSFRERHSLTDYLKRQKNGTKRLKELFVGNLYEKYVFNNAEEKK